MERDQTTRTVSGLASSSATNATDPGAYNSGTPSTLLSTKTVHTQQSDGSWSTTVVPCEPCAAHVDHHVRADETGTEDSDLNILARMQDELRRQVLGYSRDEATRDLGRIRIASKAVHEAMMGAELDLLNLRPLPSFDQLTALMRGTTLHKFKQVPEKQRCSCAAGRALDRMSCGDPVSADGWGYLSDYLDPILGVVEIICYWCYSTRNTLKTRTIIQFAN